MVMCPFYSMLPVKNTFMYLAIMYQPVKDRSYKASIYIDLGRFYNFELIFKILFTKFVLNSGFLCKFGFLFF